MQSHRQEFCLRVQNLLGPLLRRCFLKKRKKFFDLLKVFDLMLYMITQLLPEHEGHWMRCVGLSVSRTPIAGPLGPGMIYPMYPFLRAWQYSYKLNVKS